MTPKNQPFTLTIRSATAIQICVPYRSNYDNKILMSYMEVSTDLDTSAIDWTNEEVKPQTYHDAPDLHYRDQRSINDPLARWQSRDDAIRLIGSESAIIAAETLLLKNIKNIKKQQRAGKQHPAYKPMREIAKIALKHYLSDFIYHDTVTLANLTHNTNFIWMIRESGSWLFTEQSDFPRAIIDQEMKEKRHSVLFWNGATLKYLTIDQLESYYARLPKHQDATQPANVNVSY